MKKLILTLVTFALSLLSSNLISMTLESKDIPNLATKLMNGEAFAKDLASYDSDSLVRLKKYIISNPKQTEYSLLKLSHANARKVLLEDAQFAKEFSKILPTKILDNIFIHNIAKNYSLQLNKAKSKYDFSLENLTIKNNDSGIEFTVDIDSFDKYETISHFHKTDFVFFFKNQYPNIKVINLNNQCEIEIPLKDSNIIDISLYLAKSNKIFLVVIHNENHKDIFDIESIIKLEEIINQKEQKLFALQISALLKSHPHYSFVKRKLHD